MITKRLFILGLVLAVAGISHAADVLKVQGVEVAPGESVTLDIDLENETTNLMGWQCDIVLPEGLSLKLKANGKPAAMLGNRFSTTEHTISSSRLANGAYRFIATSMDGEAIPGNSGPLFTVTLIADASLAAGTKLTGSVTNIEFNTQDNQKQPFTDVTFAVTIPGGGNQKCATPTIAYDKGELVFSCETEGASFVSEVKVADAKASGSQRVQLTACYVVTVYAVADGYADSDVATATLTFGDSGLKAEGLTVEATKDRKGDVNGDGSVNVADVITVCNIVAGNE